MKTVTTYLRHYTNSWVERKTSKEIPMKNGFPFFLFLVTFKERQRIYCYGTALFAWAVISYFFIPIITMYLFSINIKNFLPFFYPNWKFPQISLYFTFFCSHHFFIITFNVFFLAWVFSTRVFFTILGLLFGRQIN